MSTLSVRSSREKQLLLCYRSCLRHFMNLKWIQLVYTNVHVLAFSRTYTSPLFSLFIAYHLIVFSFSSGLQGPCLDSSALTVWSFGHTSAFLPLNGQEGRAWGWPDAALLPAYVARFKVTRRAQKSERARAFLISFSCSTLALLPERKLRDIECSPNCRCSLFRLI